MMTINFKYLIVEKLPTFLRYPLVYAFLYAMISPIEELQTRFQNNRLKNIAEANQTGQVCRLRGLLNDTFDSQLRRITIDDGFISDWTLVWRKDTFSNDAPVKGQALMMREADSAVTVPGKKTLVFNEGNNGVHIISRNGSVGTVGFDFIVNVPTVIKPVVDENQLIAILNANKLVSKRYKIVYHG